jgi:hypothetical protein
VAQPPNFKNTSLHQPRSSSRILTQKEQLQIELKKQVKKNNFLLPNTGAASHKVSTSMVEVISVPPEISKIA